MKFKRIFKQPPDVESFILFVKTIGFYERELYVYYDELYKKNKDYIDHYITSLKEYYHSSKHNLLENMTFKKSIIIIKHIANYYNIEVVSSRRYANNSYKIYYYLRLDVFELLEEFSKESITA